MSFESPTVGGKRFTERYNIAVTKEMREDLEEISQMQYVSIPTIIRAALENRLPTYLREMRRKEK